MQQTVDYIKMRELDAVATVRQEEREEIEYSTEQYRLYYSEELTRLEFIQYMSYTYSARTDI